jgi:hypothetical protein
MHIPVRNSSTKAARLICICLAAGQEGFFLLFFSPDPDHGASQTRRSSTSCVQSERTGACSKVPNGMLQEA